MALGGIDPLVPHLLHVALTHTTCCDEAKTQCANRHRQQLPPHGTLLVGVGPWEAISSCLPSFDNRASKTLTRSWRPSARAASRRRTRLDGKYGKNVAADVWSMRAAIDKLSWAFPRASNASDEKTISREWLANSPRE